MTTQYARAKDAPDFAAFDLEAAIFNIGEERIVANALRCIEVVRAERDFVPMPTRQTNGVRIPDRLMMQSYNRRRLNAAITTRSDVSGSESLNQVGFIAQLVEEGEVLPYLNVLEGVEGKVRLPRATSDVSVSATAESGTIADPVVLTVDDINLTAKALRGSIQYTPEVDMSTDGLIDAFIGVEMARHMAGNVEQQLWSGSGMSGQVAGLEGMIATGNTTTFAGALTADISWSLMESLNEAKIRRAGRVYVASKLMSREISGTVYQPERMIHQVPLVDSTRLQRTTPTVGCGC